MKTIPCNLLPVSVHQGDRFGPYLLEERIAVGGMAEIFRARRLGAAGFARQVCIKRILPAFCADPAFVEMFIDEARTGAQLRHGNIVAIDDFGEIHGQYYLCMELISGTDLSRLIHRLARDHRGCPLQVAVFIGIEVLKALDYAHNKKGPDGTPLGIVHRDVSPHNVLLSYAGEVKLGDFGIARAASRLHHTVGNVIKGKIAYMSPEQARGERIDARTDLFALGVVLFETLTGRRPFTGPDEVAIVTALLRGERPRLRTLRPDVPEAVESVLNRLLEIDRTRRYQSAGEALAELAATTNIGSASRLLAAMVGYYFPGPASAVRHAEAFSPDALPPVITASSASLAPRSSERTIPSIDSLPDVASTVIDAHGTSTFVDSTPFAPGDATVPMAAPFGTCTVTVPTAASFGTRTDTVTAGVPSFADIRAGSDDTALPPSAVPTVTSVAPLQVQVPAAIDPQESFLQRETSPTDRTRTMIAPIGTMSATEPGGREGAATKSGSRSFRLRGLVAIGLLLLLLVVMASGIYVFVAGR